MASEQSLLDRLAHATENLLYPSESDEPVRPVSLQTVPENARRHPVDDFFAPVTEEQDWFEAFERQRARRFRDLRLLLEEELHDLAVYRSGHPEVATYVLGRTPSGTLLGIATTLIET